MATILKAAFLLALLVLPATGRCGHLPFSNRHFFDFLRFPNSQETHRRQMLATSLNDKNDFHLQDNEAVIDSSLQEQKVMQHQIQSEKSRIVRLTSGRKDKRLDWPDLDVEACGGALLPEEAMLKKGGKLGAPIGSVDNFDIEKSKYMIAYPRLGLGNSLRGYTSAFVFSLLSGRRLVVLSAGPHSKVLNVLCKAFYCFSDFIMDDPKDLISKSIKKTFRPKTIDNKATPEDLQNYIYSNVSILQSNSPSYFDLYWTLNETLKNCVYKTLNCESKHCVRVRAMNYFIGEGPRDVVGDTVEEFVQGVQSNRVVSPIRTGEYHRLKFDIGIQIRTTTSAVEGFKRRSKECRANQTLCAEEFEAMKEKERLKTEKYLSSQFWDCLGDFFKKVKKEIKNPDDPDPILNIFMATDNEALRPTFVKNIKKYKNVVYFSSGQVAHTSKLKPNTSPMPTMAEFFLLGRSTYLLSFLGYASTFGLGAAQYGNSTVVAFYEPRKGLKTCHFQLIKY